MAADLDDTENDLESPDDQTEDLTSPAAAQAAASEPLTARNAVTNQRSPSTRLPRVSTAPLPALIGLHHAGMTEAPRLRGRGGTYAANEGIVIEAVRRRLAKKPPPPH
jgi:hypothetical protein